MKRLQASLKSAEVAAKAVDEAWASAKKALAEANARAVAVDGKLDIFFIEKDMIDRSLTLEKIDRANAEFALPKRRNERNVSRAGLLQWLWRLRRKCGKNLLPRPWSIDLFGINFVSIESNSVVDPNDGSAMVFIGEVGDGEGMT